MLSELGLTTFSDLFQDNVVKFQIQWLTASNDDIRHFTSAFVSIDVSMHVLLLFLSLLYYVYFIA